MRPLVRLLKQVRHSRALRDAESLWTALRRPYQWAMDPFGRGVAYTLGGRPVRLPAACLGLNPDWSQYEPETFDALGHWLDAQPSGAHLIDVGASFGIFVTFALQIAPAVRVDAIDGDLASLKAMEQMVPARLRSRLRVILGLLGTEHTTEHGFMSATTITATALSNDNRDTAFARSRFASLNDLGPIPRYSIDGLYAELQPGPVLLKCDVEGAELAVLSGASQLLARVRPHLLLSVHPKLLPAFSATATDVASFLASQGYIFKLLAHDHEEHWWCEPLPL